MSIQFSYKQHFLAHILKNSKALFPGATSIIAVYYCKKKLGLSWIREELEPSTSLIDKDELDLDYFEAFRKQRPRYSWINHQNTSNIQTEKQLKIHGEFKHHSLLIRFPNRHDGLNDILLINFKNEDQIFRISDKKQKLSTDLKQSIASVYVRTLDVIRKQIESDATIHQIIQEHRSSINQLEIADEKEVSQLKNNQLLLIKSIVEREEKELLNGVEFSIEWDKEALALMAENFTSLIKLEKCIKDALIIAINDNDGQSTNLKVLKSHIKIGVIKEEKENEQIIDTRYQRTLSLLDRYEEAASEVVKAKLNMTGSNLANHLNPPISAAAISDAIRKHASKISHLLNTYPQRWSIIRTSFKPIQNKLYISFKSDQIAS